MVGQKSNLWLALSLLVAALTLLLWIAATPRRHAGPELISRQGLTRPLRLQAVRQQAAEELFLSLRVHHYRGQLLAEETFRDHYYDTPEWDLYRHGYSYRFRAREDAAPDKRYSIRLEQEPRFVGEGEQKLDLRTDLPSNLGASIEGGDWHQAVAGGDGLEAPARLRSILRELAIEPQRLEPRLRGELRLQRFDITDKGRGWFELDQEDWAFQLVEAGDSGPKASFQHFVFDTRLRRDDPELFRRVRTLVMLSEMLHRVRPTAQAPHEQALRALSPETS